MSAVIDKHSERNSYRRISNVTCLCLQLLGLVVPQDEPADTCDVHCNTAEEVVVAAQSNKGRWRCRALGADETENDRCVRYQEAYPTKERRIGFSDCQYCSSLRDMELDIPKLFARSPRRGAPGRKNRRSYWSGLRLTVTWRLGGEPSAEPMSARLGMRWSSSSSFWRPQLMVDAISHPEWILQAG